MNPEENTTPMGDAASTEEPAMPAVEATTEAPAEAAPVMDAPMTEEAPEAAPAAAEETTEDAGM